MKKMIALALALTSVSAFANERVEKILSAEQVSKTVAQFEIDRNADCMAPKEHQIHWMCTNGSYCGFALDITCVSQIGTFESNDQIIRLSISGNTNGENVTFTPEYNRITEYKKLVR